jgi:hypothetical protein
MHRRKPFRRNIKGGLQMRLKGLKGIKGRTGMSGNGSKHHHGPNRMSSTSDFRGIKGSVMEGANDKADVDRKQGMVQSRSKGKMKNLRTDPSPPQEILKRQGFRSFFLALAMWLP